MGAGANPRASRRDAWVEEQLQLSHAPLAAQLSQELATKLDKMARNPFNFYRGTAPLFYRDMATLPPSAFVDAATRSTWLVGDAHVQNFGAFRTGAGHNVFGVTDFDESYWGPWTWDVRRMAASIVLAAAERLPSPTDQAAAVTAFVEAYLKKIGDFSDSQKERDCHLTTNNTSGPVQSLIAKAESAARRKMLDKYTEADASGVRRFKPDASLLALPDAATKAIRAAVANYVDTIAPHKRHKPGFYALKDARLKLGSGVGSLGRYRYFLLLEGPSSDQDDSVMLVMKQQTPSAVALANSGAMPASLYEGHEGRRVALSMKAGLTDTDPLVGHTTMGGLHFLLREKAPFDQDFDSTALSDAKAWCDATAYMGKALACVHALADQDDAKDGPAANIDQQIKAVTEGGKEAFKAETLAFAVGYAEQVVMDWQSFRQALTSGSIPNSLHLKPHDIA